MKPRVCVVGDRFSFTYLAAKKRYGKRNQFRFFADQPTMLDALLKRKLRDRAVTPIWNSVFIKERLPIIQIFI